MRSSIASGRLPLPARAGLIGALWLLVLAMPAGAQTLPPPQLEPPPAPGRLSDPRLAATAVEQIQRLIGEGSYEAALAEAAKAGERHPRRVEIAFLTGVAQTRLGRNDEAIATFEALTRDYPELAEPYNNLAALYAGRDELERARATLEQATRVQPSYALAHENLGDVLLRLARREYDLAARSATTTATASRKLELIDELIRRTTPDPEPPAGQ
ncbi:MAG: tetratricopeptide repeat protein [Burkholderiaceae bacterium]|jgi:tetratricopeptide (TPR) repeat protein|nr:tetratricopeptide repeat protein [Burkholderiaceae bacterium]MEB2318460.1 tetratricopeptide repeat protein [Pseudomonadota bacterium]